MACRLATFIAQTCFTTYDSSHFTNSAWIGLSTCTSVCSALALLLIYAGIFLLCAPNATLFRRRTHEFFLLLSYNLSVTQAAFMAVGVRNNIAWDGLAQVLGVAAPIVWIFINALALSQILYASKAHSIVRRSDNLSSCLTVILTG